MAPGHDIAVRAIGSALAGLSMAFAVYMLAYGGGRTRVYGMEHLAIFAQPRGPAGAAAPAIPPAPDAVDMAATGALAPAAATPPTEMIAADAGRVWLRIGGSIRSAAPGDSIAGLGRLGAIEARDGGWVLVDDKGKELLSLAGNANGAALFTRNRIFE